MDNATKTALYERYTRAAHAMQTGVAFTMNTDPSSTSPKHLRVGVNSAMSDHGGLAKLLISKGVITEEEYLEAVTVAMEEEAAKYQEEINKRHGGAGKITLG